MSWWISRKGQHGERDYFLVNVPFETVIAITAILAAMIIPALETPSRALPVSIPFLLLGFLCFIVAKISLFRKGIWSSWGPKQMIRPFKVLYVVGYVFMVLGLLVLVLN